MMDFNEMANEIVNEEFVNLTKAVETMGAEARLRYAGKFQPVIWVNAGLTEETANLISMN